MNLRQPLVVLFFVSVLYGSQHALWKSVSIECAPSVVIWVRFALSALLLCPFAMKLRPSLRKHAVEFGLWMFLGFAAGAVGLRRTKANHCSFLLYANCLMVVALEAYWLRRPVRKTTWLASSLVAFGAMAIFYDSALEDDAVLISEHPRLGTFMYGDLWCASAAVTSAFCIVRLDSFSRRPGFKSIPFTAFSMAIVSLLATIWVLRDALSSNAGPLPFLHSSALVVSEHAWSFVYLGVLVTSVGTALQSYCQQHLSGSTVSIVFATDPVWGALFAWLLLHEALGVVGGVGAALIVLSTVLVARSNRRSPADGQFQEKGVADKV